MGQTATRTNKLYSFKKMQAQPNVKRALAESESVIAHINVEIETQTEKFKEMSAFYSEKKLESKVLPLGELTKNLV